MKPILVCLTLAMLASTTTFAQKNMEKTKVLRHVVLFKFKDDAAAADVQKVEDAFKQLKPKIDLIKDFEFGKNNSPENLNQGFTHCFFVTFASEKDRDDYLVHPAHKAFVEILKPYLDKALVIDYWARD
ncbi:Dabb family protein [Panacibacter ginsenosidivorans]|uniref:Dabb family protein n=1 Tax=Panacibacter ginsenosidivorans TaxID=1813871 RepID=A0A5B8VE86_9BACT|nr:Dabb family protein [Panacibacter ginsenosidivorans]QEC69632.1 Dabb family protein [Panacibacter ginsenosidivorans]